MRADIVGGTVFPDYDLTDHTGNHRKRSDLQGPDPIILVLSRGDWVLIRCCDAPDFRASATESLASNSLRALCGCA
jgi:hypothetical protein